MEEHAYHGRAGEGAVVEVGAGTGAEAGAGAGAGAEGATGAGAEGATRTRTGTGTGTGLHSESPPLSPSVVRVKDPAMMSRVLYSNPVCLLTARVGPGAVPALPRWNAMVISWLTPIDNYGTIFLSMNTKRYTSELLSPGHSFVLNVPTAGMEHVVTAVGKCSGRDTDKIASLGIATCRPGWSYPAPAPAPASAPVPAPDSGSGGDTAGADLPPPADGDGDEDGGHSCVAIADCVAHVVCKINTMTLNDPITPVDNTNTNNSNSSNSSHRSGKKRKKKDCHYFITATMQSVYVLDSYWDGRCFAATAEDTPPTLTFLGSGSFGYMRRS
jgi:hypothetical protein